MKTFICNRKDGAGKGMIVENTMLSILFNGGEVSIGSLEFNDEKKKEEYEK